MSVIPIHANPTVPVIERDGTEMVLEILGEERFNSDFLLEMGWRVCETCGTWCKPVEVQPDTRCARCLLRELEVALIRGVYAKETPTELAVRVFRLVVRPDEPAPKRVS